MIRDVFASSKARVRLTAVALSFSALAGLAGLTTASAAPAQASTQVYQLQSGNGVGICLNANDSGSTAGKNGDKVQAYSCNNSKNDLWYRGSCHGVNCEWVNDEYTHMCLNANDTGGLKNGSHVQLWSCGTGSPYNGLWQGDANYYMGNGDDNGGIWDLYISSDANGTWATVENHNNLTSGPQPHEGAGWAAVPD
jgi:hypothetical protein